MCFLVFEFSVGIGGFVMTESDRILVLAFNWAGLPISFRDGIPVLWTSYYVPVWDRLPKPQDTTFWVCGSL